MKERLPKLGGHLRMASAAILGAMALALVATWAGVARAQSPGTSSEPGFIKNLHITGFAQNTSATWIESNNMKGNFGTTYHTSGTTTPGNSDRWGLQSENSLAAERQLVQIDVNDDFTENDSMFMRSWFAYEPSYPWEVACLGAGSAFFGAANGLSAAKTHCNSDFYNVYGVRELWFKHRFGPLQFFLGRQIVTWGESIFGYRVGDQINPRDTSWNFGFANPEQSYMPLWMIHPILNLPSVGPFSSNFAELVYIPGFDFMYTQVDYSNDSVDGQDDLAGRVGIGAASPGGRFAGQLDCRTLFAPGPAAFGLNHVLIPAVGVNGDCGVGPPVAEFQTGTGFPGAGPGDYIAETTNKIPSATWGNSQIGFRLHTLVENTELTSFFYWNHEYSPTLKILPDACGKAGTGNGINCINLGGGAFLRNEASYYPQYMGGGITGNRPIYLPGALAQLPFVVRGEVFYKNHAAFNTSYIPGTVYTNYNPHAGTPSSVYHSDTVTWLAALDLDSAYTPWLTTTGNLNVTYEIFDQIALSPSRFMLDAPSFFTPAYHNNVSMGVSVSTSWWWGAVSPSWFNQYNPEGETWLIFPTLQLTPPWTNKYFTTLGWVEILGSDRYNLNGGLFKGKNMFTARFQYNFSLM
jgi:hypothetical protein